MNKQKDTVTMIAELREKCSAQESRLAYDVDKMGEQARTINDQRGNIERLQKEIEAYRNENITLRENLQRCKGYIDRVNEDSRQMEPIVEPPRMHERQRGPQLINLGGINGYDDGMSNYSSPTRRGQRYG